MLFHPVTSSWDPRGRSICQWLERLDSEPWMTNCSYSEAFFLSCNGACIHSLVCQMLAEPQASYISQAQCRGGTQLCSQGTCASAETRRNTRRQDAHCSVMPDRWADGRSAWVSLHAVARVQWVLQVESEQSLLCRQWGEAMLGGQTGIGSSTREHRVFGDHRESGLEGEGTEQKHLLLLTSWLILSLNDSDGLFNSVFENCYLYCYLFSFLK